MLRAASIRCLAAAIAVPCTCCSGPSTASDAGDVGGDVPESCVPGPGETLELRGWWGARAWVRVEAVTSPEGIVRMCPDPYPGVAVLTLMIHLTERTGNRIDYDFVVCEILMPRVTAALAPCEEEEFVDVQLELGPHLAAYIPNQTFHGYADVGGVEPCSDYISDNLDITYGYDATAIGPDDPLPGWDMDCASTTPEACVDGWEHVFDEDADGHPGVSLQVTTEPVDTIRGQAYTTWRTNPHMHGVAWSSTLVQGDLSPTMEYEVVGSGADLQGIPMDEPTVKRNIPRFHIPASGSSFRMVRVDGALGAVDLDEDGDGSVSCDELMARSELLE